MMNAIFTGKFRSFLGWTGIFLLIIGIPNFLCLFTFYGFANPFGLIQYEVAENSGWSKDSQNFYFITKYPGQITYVFNTVTHEFQTTEFKKIPRLASYNSISSEQFQSIEERFGGINDTFISPDQAKLAVITSKPSENFISSNIETQELFILDLNTGEIIFAPSREDLLVNTRLTLFNINFTDYGNGSYLWIILGAILSATNLKHQPRSLGGCYLLNFIFLIIMLVLCSLYSSYFWFPPIP